MRAGVGRLRAVAVVVLALLAGACEDQYKDHAALQSRAVVLQREVDGLRAVVSRLERHEPVLPPGDVAISIDEALVRGVVSAQLPLTFEVSGNRVHLDAADVSFRGHAMVRLRGTVAGQGWLGLEAQVEAIGALDRLEIDPDTSTLSARIALDHLTIEKASGLERFVSGTSLDEIASLVRAGVAERLPRVQIPVRVQKTIDLPAVTRGAVRIDAASLPLAVWVSQVTPVRGRLWIALHLEPGEARAAEDGSADGSADGTPSAGDPK